MSQDESDKSGKTRADLSHWRREHDAWDSDVSRWQADHQRALIELEHIAQTVVSHGEALRRYSTDLEAHKQTLHAIESSGRPDLVSELTMQKMCRDHENCRLVHDRIRRHHENVTALLEALSDAIRAPV